MADAPAIPEADLIEGCRRRDAAALNELATHFSTRIYRWAFARLRDPEEAHDVMQETFARFLEKIDSFEGRCKLSTWLYRVAHNLMSDRSRERASERRALAAIGPEEAEEEEAGAALDLLQPLPSEERSAAILYYVEGLPLSEISEVLGLPVSTLKWRLFEARRRLRDGLQRRKGDESHEL